MTIDGRPRLGALWFALQIVSAGGAIGCGGASPQSEMPAPLAPSASGAPSPASSAPPTAPRATPPEPAEAASAEPAAKESTADVPDAPPAPAGKNITYRMTPSGLVIELDGVRIEPRAEPMKLGGGWGVKILARIKAIDDHEHHVQAPTGGPFMVAEEIDRGGKKELVPDARKGDGELTLANGTSTPVERELRKPIVAGQSLTLYVGLWGLGKDGGDRKPIKKLFVVKMVAGTHKPQPVVSAPD